MRIEARVASFTSVSCLTSKDLNKILVGLHYLIIIVNATVMCPPAHRHDLSKAIARIEVNGTSGGSTSALHPPYVPRKWMYLFTVNGKFKFYLHIHEAQCLVVPARQYLADKIEKGFSVVISLWVPLYLYIISNSPHTIMDTVPTVYQMALKC